jgi:hypothetical protein
MAQDLNMESKHSIEKQTAHYVDWFHYRKRNH